MGLTMAYFSLLGNIPELRTELQMKVRGEITNRRLSFITWLDNSSYPEEVLDSRDLMIFSISWVETYFQFILVH